MNSIDNTLPATTSIATSETYSDRLEFLKLFFAAVAVALAFSISAIGVTLLLVQTSSANAQSTASTLAQDDSPGSPWILQDRLWVLEDDAPYPRYMWSGFSAD